MRQLDRIEEQSEQNRNRRVWCRVWCRLLIGRNCRARAKMVPLFIERRFLDRVLVVEAGRLVLAARPKEAQDNARRMDL